MPRRLRRLAARVASALGALALVLAAPQAARTAPEPYEINVILPLTGAGTFIGHGEMQAIQALEPLIDKSGGIRGRPVKFVVYDDQSNPQVDVQLLNGILAKKVPVFIGSSIVAMCSSMIPLVRESGPVQYCLSPGVHPAPGSFVFSSSVSTDDLIADAVRYFRERGMRRIAVMTSSDASGQDAERALNEAFAAPENQSITVVDREHFNISDVSVAAQMARIKAAQPQVLIAWSTGTPLGTVLRGAKDAALDMPILTTNGNLTYAQMQQYAGFLPKELYFPGVPCVAPGQVTDRATKAAVEQYLSTFAAMGVKADFVQSTLWDPALLIVDALRKLGPSATADQLRNYFANLNGWVGVNGRYDFKASPQRGLGQDSALIVRWDPAKGTWIGVSRLGGTPLRS